MASKPPDGESKTKRRRRQRAHRLKKAGVVNDLVSAHKCLVYMAAEGTTAAARSRSRENSDLGLDSFSACSAPRSRPPSPHTPPAAAVPSPRTPPELLRPFPKVQAHWRSRAATPPPSSPHADASDAAASSDQQHRQPSMRPPQLHSRQPSKRQPSKRQPQLHSQQPSKRPATAQTEAGLDANQEDVPPWRIKELPRPWYLPQHLPWPPLYSLRRCYKCKCHKYFTNQVCLQVGCPLNNAAMESASAV